ncbi:transcription factor FapR [Bacillus sp. HMF5848]|uniref:transcription factor FapR n=1 Tax=Bacillus sp. HMF5848 TaxID=2495421 RepID=UPI000F77D8D8|nr:transcription factor FapR [Bacillus sp. HMF5848]RSK26990.1 transcription factor FapR [Bacillus sp. HMF5848]
MKKSKYQRQALLKETIEQNPFITDEELATQFSVSIQTIRLDRMELSIPELRERIKHVAEQQLDEKVRALPLHEVIGEIIDIEPDHMAISMFEVLPEHAFSRNQIARGHHLFAQANSLAVAVINDELALTAKAVIRFTRPVKVGERVIAKAKVMKVEDQSGRRTIVEVMSSVSGEQVFSGEFEMYRSSQQIGKKEGANIEDSD